MRYAIGIVLLLMAVTYLVVSESNLKAVEAQDTAPQWEYAVLIHSTETAFAFTSDLETNNALNDLLMDGDESVNLVVALNVMGDEGWELADIINGATAVYVFKREK